jgi:hypothetical protein
MVKDLTKSTYVEGWDNEAPAADSRQGIKFKGNGTVLREEIKSKYNLD